MARAIHRLSPRRYNPMVVVHCGALTETLIEGELFGHAKGAFTGAQYRKKGKFEAATGGTVFLDREEFYGLPPSASLLEARVLRELHHETGHLRGLSHCPDWSCVMSPEGGRLLRGLRKLANAL